MSRLFVLALLFTLTACGAVPKPFRETPRVTTGNLLLDVPTAVGIAVLPVRGAPAPIDMQISRAVAQRLQASEIPAEAVTENRGLGFTLLGEATTQDPTATEVSVVVTWTLRSRRGANASDPTRTFRQVVTLTRAVWQGGHEIAAGRLGTEAGLAIGDLLNGIAPPALAAAPAPAQPMPTFPSITVKPVEGAPGDGQESLRLAVLQALNINGVRRDDVNPDVTLTCRIVITPFDSSRQKVEISWRATTRDGKDLGNVNLDNTIPVGALDGAWGPTAFAIADAALNDLLTLLLSKPAP